MRMKKKLEEHNLICAASFNVLGRMKDILKANDYSTSHEEIARACGLKRQSVDKWERNNVSIKSIYIDNFCHCLGISLPAFYGEQIPKSMITHVDYELRKRLTSMSEENKVLIIKIIDGMDYIRSDSYRKRISF